MKYLPLIVLACFTVSCAPKKTYTCTCISTRTGQELHTYGLEYRTHADANNECNRIGNTHNLSGAQVYCQLQ